MIPSNTCKTQNSKQVLQLLMKKQYNSYIFSMASKTIDVRDINLPRSEVGWCKNSRNQNLHFMFEYYNGY